MAANKDKRPWMMPFQLKSRGQETFQLPSRGLKLIGIRFYTPSGSYEDEVNARYIQKSLYGKTEWFYFNKPKSVIRN